MANKISSSCCYLVVFISTLLFANGYLFYLFFVVKDDAVQCCSM